MGDGNQEESSKRGCRGISIQELRNKYSAVILAYGAISDRKLGLPGEDVLKGIFSSRRIANWYNGSLDNDLTPDEFDLERTGKIAIIGNGNIACDISRMLLQNVDNLRTSDAPQPVLNQLAKSNVHCIEMIGRRGIT